MNNYERLFQVVTDSGLWDGERRETHRFRLSPSVYEITPTQQTELEALGAALHDCLAGLGRIAAIAQDSRFGHSHAWKTIARILRTGVPNIYHGLEAIQPGRTPAICKVDLMVSASGEFRIAEIDGHNKHGLGYSTLAARLRQAARPRAVTFPGVVALIAEEVRRRGAEHLTLLSADQERFYLPEFRIFQRALAVQGIGCDVVGECEANLQNGWLVGPSGAPARLLVDLPFLFRHPELNAALADRYRNREVDFLIPPKPLYGSKAVLALLRNDMQIPEREAILCSQIPAAALARIRQYIPRTFLVSKQMPADALRRQCGDGRYVLKEAISSGMKGTVFIEDEHWETVMKRACGSYDRFILQEEVINRSFRFHHYDDDGVAHEGDWFVRVTVHYAHRRVADIVATARQDKKVHGAKDSLQLGTIVS